MVTTKEVKDCFVVVCSFYILDENKPFRFVSQAVN